MNNLFLLTGIACLMVVCIGTAAARDARLDALVSQGIVTEAQIAAAETEGPSNWLAKQAYDVYIGGFIQPYVAYAEDGDAETAFAIRRARLTITGDLSEMWDFIIQYDLVPNAITLAGVRAKVGDGKIGLGQFLTPLVLESYTSSGALDTIQRAQCVSFSGDWGDPGLYLWYPLLDGKVDVQAAVSNGTGPGLAEENDAKDYYLRVNVMPFKSSEGPAGGLMVGAAYNQGENAEFDDEGVDLGDFDHTVWVATVQWVWDQLKVQGEYVDISQDSTLGTADMAGWYVYALYSLPVSDVVVAPLVKYETLDPNAAAVTHCDCPDGNWITLGVRVSFAGTHGAKLEANYIIESLDVGAESNEFILQMTVNF